MRRQEFGYVHREQRPGGATRSKSVAPQLSLRLPVIPALAQGLWAYVVETAAREFHNLPGRYVDAVRPKARLGVHIAVDRDIVSSGIDERRCALGLATWDRHLSDFDAVDRDTQRHPTSPSVEKAGEDEATRLAGRNRRRGPPPGRVRRHQHECSNYCKDDGRRYDCDPPGNLLHGRASQSRDLTIVSHRRKWRRVYGWSQFCDGRDPVGVKQGKGRT